jgi:RHS repeat-associated protein
MAMTLTKSSGDPVITKYYFAAGNRVAMDRDGVVQWLVGDHLGTTSVVLDGQGSVVAESRHYPYGEERWRWPQEGTFPTEYRFTGQRQDAGLGLYFMGARQYDPALGRWLSADTIVPDPANPQSYNRYSWALGNPLRYVDPTGHQQEPVTEVLRWVSVVVTGGSAALVVELGIAGGAATVTIVLAAGSVIAVEWVLVGPLGPDHPLPEEHDPERIGATYPLPESSTLSLESTTNQANAGMKASTLELELPTLETSTDTYGLELPTALEARGKDTPPRGSRGPRERLLPEHRSEPGRILPPRYEPPRDPGPPKWPPEKLADLLVWSMYWMSQLVDETQLK